MCVNENQTSCFYYISPRKIERRERFGRLQLIELRHCPEEHQPGVHHGCLGLWYGYGTHSSRAAKISLFRLVIKPEHVGALMLEKARPQKENKTLLLVQASLKALIYFRYSRKMWFDLLKKHKHGLDDILTKACDAVLSVDYETRSIQIELQT